MRELLEEIREQRTLVAAIRARSAALRGSATHRLRQKGPLVQGLLLLQMSESLITAHKAAKIDDDGYTLDLIEDALRHVGERLARETSDGRRFLQRGLAPE